MIFDTGSNWLWVNSRFCENCAPSMAKFDERNSSTFSFYNVVLDLHYGSGDVYGYNSHDSVCILKGKCAHNFSFMSVGMQRGLGTLRTSGIVGMSPNHFEKMGDLFIEKMRDAGVINKAIFSLMIELTNNQSKITFGGIDMANMAALGSQMNYHNITKDSVHWQLKLKSMTLSSEQNISGNYSGYVFGKDADIIVDSGTSFLLMPKAARKDFINFLYYELDIFCYDSSIPVCFCDDKQYKSSFPDFTFRIDGIDYFMPKESYVYQENGVC
jgi:hypothetical protein